MAGDREELENLRKMRRLAELEAKASGQDIAPLSGPSTDPNLRNYKVPERVVGLPVPYASGPTDYVANQGQGIGVSVPSNAPEMVQKGILRGAQHGDTVRQEKDRLLERGHATLDSFMQGQSGNYLSPVWPDADSKRNRSKSKAVERVGAASAGLADLTTFGFDDEIASLAAGPEAKQEVRGLKDAAWKHHPASTMAGGSAALLIPGQGIRGASTGGKAASGALRGGLFGAAYGVGSGEDAADRALKGVGYGAMGGVAGAGMVAGGRGIDYLARKVPGSAELRALTSKIVGGKNLTTLEVKALEGAINEVQTVARVSGRKIDRTTAKNELIQALTSGRPNDFMFEALGEEGIIAAQGAAQPGMAGATDIAEALGKRGEEQYARINSAVSKLAGGKNISSSLDELGAVKKEEASPLYEQAYKVPVNVNTPEFKAVEKTLKLPEFQAGRSRGESIWRLESNTPDGKFSDLPFFRQIQYIKEGVDDRIGSLIRQGDTAQAGALISRKNEMLSQVDAMNPVYAQARQTWAGAAAQKTALELGEKMLGTPGYSPTGARWREIQAAYGKMSEAEKVAFSVGMYDRAIQMAGDQAATATANSIPRKFMSPNTEQRVREILPAAQADEFLDLINREYTQQVTTNRVLPAAGSKTAGALSAVDAVRSATGGARAVVGQLAEPQRLLGRAQQGAREWMENNAKRQGSITNFLLRQADDPELRKALGLGGEQQMLPPPNAQEAGAAARLPAEEPVQNGMLSNGAFTDTIAGAGLGSVSGNFVDYNQDGVIDQKDVAIGAAGGAVGLRTGRKVAQRATKSRPAGMLQYEQARLRVMNANPDLQPGSAEYQSAVMAELKSAGYGGTQSRDLKRALAPEVDTAGIPEYRLRGVKPEDQWKVVVSQKLGQDGNPSQGHLPSGQLIDLARSPEEQAHAVFNGINTLKKQMGMTDDEAFQAIREATTATVTKDDVAKLLLKGDEVEDVYRLNQWLFMGDDAATLTPEQLQRAMADLPPDMMPADPPVTNGFGGGVERKRTQNKIRDGLQDMGGRARAPAGQRPASIGQTGDELRQSPLIADDAPTGITPDAEDAFSARNMLTEKLIADGMDPQQARFIAENMDDGAVAALSPGEMAQARGRYPGGDYGATGDGGGGILGLMGAGGAAGIWAALSGGQKKEEPNPLSQILASADQATRSGRGLPETPSMKPQDAMTALLERPEPEVDPTEVTPEEKARGVMLKRVEEDGTVYEFVNGQWKRAS